MRPHPSSTLTVPDAGAVPRHVAIIMDGNGRWATARRLPRFAGHTKGVEAVRAWWAGKSEAERTALTARIERARATPPAT